jgi:hypothetical protein
MYDNSVNAGLQQKNIEIHQSFNEDVDEKVEELLKIQYNMIDKLNDVIKKLEKIFK